MSSDGEARVPANLLEALRDLAIMISQPASIEGILQRVGDWCAEVLPVDGVGVLLRDEAGGLMVATASSDLGRVVEQFEADLGEGPCSHSLATGQLIPVPDLAEAHELYPNFVPRALEAGVRSIYAVPMSFRSEQVGSLDVISRDPLVLDDDQLAIAQLLADVTISYIANSRMLEEVSALSANLQRALDNRVVIEQAKGTLAERHGLSPTEAFERMRAHARSNRRPINDVAQDVLTGALRL